MTNSFSFKQFTVHQNQCAQRVSTDACLFGAWVSEQMDEPAYVLDIGAGTGVLMLMIAQRSNAIIDGIEIEHPCFEQLKENISTVPFPNHFNAIHGDVKEYSFLVDYDLIISNPPFYENQLTADNDAKNLAWHSSMLRLEELFTIAKQNLSEKGKFAVILPYSRKEEALSQGKAAELFLQKIAYVRHSVHHAYARILLYFSKELCNVSEEVIVIKNEDGSYTNRMIELLDDYYLNIKG